MDGKCLKSNFYVILNGLKNHVNSMKVSKSYNDNNDEGHFLDVDVQYLENSHNLRNDLSFLPQRKKTERKKINKNCMIKNNILYT